MPTDQRPVPRAWRLTFATASASLAVVLAASPALAQPTCIACHRQRAEAHLRAPVDAFFDGVLVMAEDPAVRDNRLALLNELGALFLRVADLSRLQG